MKHKYPINTWVRFYQQGKLVIGIIQYLNKREPGEQHPQYSTDIGAVSENAILEARLP